MLSMRRVSKKRNLRLKGKSWQTLKIWIEGMKNSRDSKKGRADTMTRK